MERELVSDAQMSASSTSDPVKASASNGRLNFNNAWCSATSNEEPLFLQIDLNEVHIITAVSVIFHIIHPQKQKGSVQPFCF